MGTALGGYSTSSDSILRFRTAYMRVLAKVWQDDTLMEELKTQDNVLDWDIFLNELPGQKSLPWTAKISCEVQENNKVLWDPGISGGWIAPNDNIKIMLPVAPASEDDFSEALAQYFQMFPTILGLKSVQSHCNGIQSEVDKLANSAADGSALEFINLSNHIIQGIALCWMKSDSHGHPRENLRQELLDGGFEALTRLTGAHNPWNFNIHFVDVQEEEQQFNVKLGWDNEKKIWGPMYNRIIINIPQPPGKTMSNKALGKNLEVLALAVYNSSGAYYPFTCP